MMRQATRNRRARTPAGRFPRRRSPRGAPGRRRSRDPRRAGSAPPGTPARPARRRAGAAVPRSVGAAHLGGVLLHLSELLADAVEVLAVGEVPVAEPAAIAPRGGRVAALEDLRVRSARPGQRLGLEAEVPDPVEVTSQLGRVRRPDSLERGDELGRSPVPLVVLQPGLAELAELVGEPAGYHVHRDPAVRQVVGCRHPLGQHARMPEPGVDGRDQLEPLGGQQQRQAEAGRLVLVTRPPLTSGTQYAMRIGSMVGSLVI